MERNGNPVRFVRASGAYVTPKPAIAPTQAPAPAPAPTLAIVMAMAMALSLAAAGCGDDGGPAWDGWTDTASDMDATGDDDTAATSWRTCSRSCAAPAECCLATGAACGSYPNSWECDGACMVAGCTGDVECQAWATGLSLPGASDFRCTATVAYYETSLCVKGCSGAAECCPSGTDCTGYPNRYACEGGACKLAGCVDDAECSSWAASKGATDAGLYECRSFGFSGMPMCAKRCTATAECCPGGACGGYPENLACLEGHCISTCADDAECRSWATARGLTDPARYACHPF